MFDVDEEEVVDKSFFLGRPTRLLISAGFKIQLYPSPQPDGSPTPDI